jgi:hypothetical protein
MHDPGQGRTGMKIEFGTPDLSNPLFTSLGLTAIRPEVTVQGSQHDFCGNQNYKTLLRAKARAFSKAFRRG